MMPHIDWVTWIRHRRLTRGTCILTGCGTYRAELSLSAVELQQVPSQQHITTTSRRRTTISEFSYSTRHNKLTAPRHCNCCNSIGALKMTASIPPSPGEETPAFDLNLQHGHKDLVQAVAFNTYGDRCATGSVDGKIRVFNRHKDGTWRLCDTWTAHGGEIIEVTQPPFTNKPPCLVVFLPPVSFCRTRALTLFPQFCRFNGCPRLFTLI